MHNVGAQNRFRLSGVSLAKRAAKADINRTREYSQVAAPRTRGSLHKLHTLARRFQVFRAFWMFYKVDYMK
jgi:hypothetical protein